MPHVTKRFTIGTLALALFAASCGDDNSPTTPSAQPNPTFTAELRASNENPPISGPEAGGTGNATVTFDSLTRDSAGNVTGGTATFIVNVGGLPPNTPLNISHIHQGAAGVNGGVVVNSTLVAGEVTTNAAGSATYTKSGLRPQNNDYSIFNGILNNPSGYYFNVHSTLNPGGVVRGQLVRVQ